MKILFFGDIMSKAGRRAMVKALPDLKIKYEPDFIVANGENLAHGKGITEKTVNEATEAGVDVFTSGNHIFKRREGLDILKTKDTKFVRPANYPPNVPGVGYKYFTVGAKKLLLINLIGRVFFREDFDCPFRAVDKILENAEVEKPDAIMVDFHVEATSESKAMGYYLDGRVSAILGTHTHVPTADARILESGTAYISDVGMVGARDSVLGMDREAVTEQFLSQLPFKGDPEESGVCEVNAVLVDINGPNKAKKIDKIYEEVEV